jgi:myo-inositol-1(or 4)-monophosphatase
MQTDRHLIRLELPSTFDMLDIVQVLSDRLSSIAGLDEDTTHWVSVAVRESVINAVKHGNREDRSKHVTVEFTLAPRVEPKKFTVEVLDEGEGFDYEVVALDPRYLAVAIEAALAAGRLQLQYFRRDLQIQKKGVIDLVTEADLAVEQDIRDRVERHFPSHVFLGEEAAHSAPASDSPFRWIVDPIDGTTNFVHGLPLFCVSIALQIEGRVELGVVYSPVGDELFTAERGEGARLNGVRIHVTREASMIDALLVTGFPPQATDMRGEQLAIFGELMSRARAVRRLGSAALDLAYVAAGRFDAFWERSLHAWDVAAGTLLVEEAGGRVTSFGGGSFDPFGGQILASNGALHSELVDILGDVMRRVGGGS